MTSSAQLKRDYIWNTLGSVMNALASVVLLILVTQILGAYEGGVFSIAFAIAQQFQIVGHYEMRPYQATDVEERFSFGVYLASRIVTCSLMMVGVFLYAFYSNGLSFEAVLLALLASLRFFDAFEDVFHGMFQQQGRLDIAGKAFFGRVCAMLVSFAVVLLVSRNLLIACIASLGASLIAFIVLNVPEAKRRSTLRPVFSASGIKSLLVACLPLFLGSFLLMYVVNAPRYGIESAMSKEFQTFYSILFMPAMVINLLSGFVFKPLLNTLASLWARGDRRAFFGILAKGLLVVIGVTAAALLVGYWLGIPVLSFIYGIDLGGYRPELMVLLVGGGFNAAAVIGYYGLVTMRCQKAVLVGYGVTALMAFMAVRPAIVAGGLWGASVLYTCLMALLALILFALVAFLARR
ncbi:lipopolysaccharide biosynthesis protein [Adlercreutzia faecimuris]|uniref:Lipopolysaccharide biosynthesis protein n=1 Tax=Adlercreutzia faecimuris TaxID=2897341 RepID=A0ABS9WG58_9ACTN|nr:lipopolysaccharide biosynthesis protein [Adlercreutzia sp. JBNU-10]MCI2241779.1 lipopolysaccharide biosynthesis protein [Adlercreutzia sp. JBNU-10]